VRRPLLIALAVLGLAGCGDEAVGPRLLALLPDRGAPGLAVDLVGERLAGASVAVSFGTTPAPVVQLEERRARVQVPTRSAGATTVVITVDGRPSAPLTFTVDGSPDSGT